MALHQEHLLEESARLETEQSSREPPAPHPSAHAPVWLQRMSLVVLVLFCFYIGGLLAMLPWSPRYWDQNGWLLAHPVIEGFVNRGWVRGVVSGLGLLDIWVGISELLHYRDFRG